MAKRKLTDKVKKEIKKSKGRVALKNYSGQALTYLKKYRALSKARKIKEESTLRIGETVIPKNSEMYQIIERLAKTKKITVKKATVVFKKAIQELAKDGRITFSREIDYLIDTDIAKAAKVYFKKKKKDKGDVIYYLQSLKSDMMGTDLIYDYVNIVSYRDLKNSLFINAPYPEEYTDYYGEALLEFIKTQYPNISYTLKP